MWGSINLVENLEGPQDRPSFSASLALFDLVWGRYAYYHSSYLKLWSIQICEGCLMVGRSSIRKASTFRGPRFVGGRTIFAVWRWGRRCSPRNQRYRQAFTPTTAKRGTNRLFFVTSRVGFNWRNYLSRMPSRTVTDSCAALSTITT